MIRKHVKIQALLIGLALVGSIAFAENSASAEPVKIAIIDSGATHYVDSAISFTSILATQDPLGHGTIIAEMIRNENPDAVIVMLQVCEQGKHGFGPSRQALRKAMQWVLDHDVDIVNISLTTPYDKEFDALVERATLKQGVVVVAAGGNKSLTNGFAAGKDGLMRRSKVNNEPLFPSSNKNVISVGAVDALGNIEHYSARDCDVYAQGKAAQQQGTSFACARVTAHIAQILQAQSTDLSKSQIIHLLQV